MRIAAVICEYNPLHKGHVRQLAEAREHLQCDTVIGIMSGNYVQRGEPGLFPKQLRAAAALQSGMDLVLELPAILTLQSAERYAENAVRTLDAMGCVDTLFFGAETPDTEVLMKIAAVLAKEDSTFQTALHDGLQRGLSFAAARANAVQTLLGKASAELLSLPNNILAVEYCKALIRIGSTITPYAMPRKGGAHDGKSLSDGISGLAIRQAYLQGDDISAVVPEAAMRLFADAPIASVSFAENALLANLCLIPTSRLSRIADVSEGLENALKREALTASTLAEALTQVKSKRYSYSRLRRIALNAYLGITREDSRLAPSYIRILDFNETGQTVLHTAKETATLPLAKNGSQIREIPDALALWKRELELDAVYRFFQK